MKSLKSLTFFAAALVIFTSCQKDFQSDVISEQHSPLLEEKNVTSKASTNAALNEKLTKLRAKLPAGYEKRLQQSTSQLLKRHPQYRKLVSKALAIEPTECQGNTPINQWLGNEIADWDENVIFFALVTGMLDLPTYEALLFVNNSNNQYFGVHQEFSQNITKGFKDLKRFWNIQSSNMVLGAMHGNMLRDKERIIRTDMAVYGTTREQSEPWADLILSLLEFVPQYRNGDHPIFTFNAYAIAETPYPPYQNIPNKIIMGDGIVQGLSKIGYSDVASQAILAHEFGHHIQFQLNLFGSVNTPEATRRTELMADAYAAYYLSHSRGASMQWKRVKQFFQVFFNIGDCAVNENSHHGTPAQRMAAAEWGYSIANKAQKQGHILTTQQFTKLFEAQLPVLVK